MYGLDLRLIVTKTRNNRPTVWGLCPRGGGPVIRKDVCLKSLIAWARSRHCYGVVDASVWSRWDLGFREF